MAAPGEEMDLVTRDVNVLALMKGEERYVFLFDDEHRGETLRTLGRYASNPELSFTWYDAAVLSQKVRHLTEMARNEPTLDGRFELPQHNEDNPPGPPKSVRLTCGSMYRTCMPPGMHGQVSHGDWRACGVSFVLPSVKGRSIPIPPSHYGTPASKGRFLIL
jgi:hypothetical protein